MAVTSCAWCLKRGSESKNREEKPVHVSQSQPRDGRKGPRAGNIVNSSKSARPPWAMVTTGITSPQPPSTAFKASVLHFSHSFPHAGPGGRRTREGCAHCRRPRKSKKGDIGGRIRRENEEAATSSKIVAELRFQQNPNQETTFTGLKIGLKISSECFL